MPDLSLFLSLVFFLCVCIVYVYCYWNTDAKKKRQRKSPVVIIKQRIRKPEGNGELWFMNCESIGPFILGITLNVNCYLQMRHFMLLLLSEQKVPYISQKIPPNRFITGRVGVGGGIQGSDW